MHKYYINVNYIVAMTILVTCYLSQLGPALGDGVQSKLRTPWKPDQAGLLNF